MSFFVKLIVVIWVCALLVGLVASSRYDGTPGEPSYTASEWPRDASFNFSRDVATLTMLLHPRCSCSKASLAELNKIVLEFPKKLDVHLLFRSDFSDGKNIAEEALWSLAEAIPGATKHLDPHGTNARRFGANTSGHVAVYNTAGQLVFSGGITQSRGHLGASAGSDAIRQILIGINPSTVKTDTFGCGIQNKDSQLPRGKQN